MVCKKIENIRKCAQKANTRLEAFTITKIMRKQAQKYTNHKGKCSNVRKNTKCNYKSIKYIKRRLIISKNSTKEFGSMYNPSNYPE